MSKDELLDSVEEFTNQDFKQFKRHFKLNNKDIASIIGTSEQNVKMMTNKDLPLSTWARAFVYMWKNKTI